MRKQMTKKEMLEYLKGKSQDEIREFIALKLIEIADEAEKLSVEQENYEKASEVLKIKKRVQKKYLKNKKND